MKNTLLLLVFTLCSSLFATKPNVLFIAIDDMKPMLGCYGDKVTQTPNMDRLASSGTVFLNSQCQFPVCGPSRASIMTGIRPETTGVLNLKTKMRESNPNLISIPQHFKANGYTTTGSGKIFDPRCIDNKSDADKPSWSKPFIFYKSYSGVDAEKKNGKIASKSYDLPDESFIDYRIATRGIKQMKELASDEQPFFLAVGFKKPHLPFVAPKRFWDMYSDDDIQLHPFQQKAKDNSGYGYWICNEMRGYSPVPKKGDLSNMDEKLQKDLIHGYMACISWVDHLVGMLLDELNTLGLAENTIVVLWGDHGFHLGDYAMWGKHTPFEQAARSPLIISSPSQNSKGVVTEAPAEFTDVFPTLCDLAGISPPLGLHGVSLSPTLNDPKAYARKGATTMYKNKGAYGYSYRTDQYRYIEWVNSKTHKVVGKDLFDLKNDPIGKENLANKEEYLAIVQKLSAELHQDATGWKVLEKSIQ